MKKTKTLRALVALAALGAAALALGPELGSSIRHKLATTAMTR